MTIRRISASGVGRLVACPASLVLPQHEKHTKQGEAGTENHEPIAAFLNHRPARSGQDFWTRFAPKFPKIIDGVGMPRGEVAYVLNVKDRTAREIGVDIERKYDEAIARAGLPPLGKYDIPMSVDVIGFKDGVPWTRDWKFGVTSDPWQPIIHALALVAIHDVSEVDTGFVFIDAGAATYEVEEKTLYLQELDEHAEKLVARIDALERIEAELAAGKAVQTNEGPWCTYCGALPFCPSKMRLVRGLVEELSINDNAIAALTVEQCGHAWQKLKSIQKLADRLEESLKERMAVEPFPLANGKQMKMITKPGWAYYDRDKTTSLLKKLGASDQEIGKAMKIRADSHEPREVKR